jgi:catechol-2,3-dioxygenase
MPGSTLDHVQIAAPPGCEPAARHYFGDLLGLSELPKPAPLIARGGCWFALGDRQLHVGVDPDFAPALKAHVALRLEPAELDDLATHLTASGFPVTWDTDLPAERRFYSADPWGNRIEFLAAAKPA